MRSPASGAFTVRARANAVLAGCLLAAWEGPHRDIAGHERFGCMTHVYYKYAMAALIVFALTRPATFDAVLKVRPTP